MGEIVEVITGRATNPAALTAVTMNTGDSATTRSFGGAAARLEGLWSQQATAGFVRVRSSRLHDPTRGITMAAPAALPVQLLPDGIEQVLKETDALTIEIQGGGAETDAIALLIAYNNVSEGTSKLRMWEQIKGMIAHIAGHQVDAAGPATTGDWSAGTNFNNLSGILKANTYYAILGYTLDTASLAVAVRGPDTGNYRVGGPGALQPIESRDWFIRQSLKHNAPRIPVFNSQNVGNTQTFIARVGVGGTINVTWLLAELTGTP